MSRTPLSHSIVWRLRAAMAAIFCLVLGLMTIAWLGLEGTERAQAELTDEAVPTLLRSKSISDHIELLDQSFSKIVSAKDAAELQRAVSANQAQKTGLSAAAGDDARYLGPAVQLGRMTLDAAALSEEIIATQAAMSLTSARAVEAAERLKTGVERRTVDVGARIETLLRRGEAGGYQAELAVAIAELNDLAAMNGLADRIKDAIADVIVADAASRLGELFERLGFTLRSLVLHLAQMPGTPDRAAFAAGVAELRDFVLGPDGLIATKRSALDLNARLYLTKASHGASVRELASVAGRDLETTREQLVATAGDVSDISGSAVVSMRVTGAVSLIVLVLTTYFLIERQVIRRLALATDAVRQIARGDHEATVRVSGADELGELAAALEIFKDNAKELQRSNEELSRFAQAASHDLRSPLRAIHDLAQWTIEDCGEALPPEGRENLELLLKRAARLTALLNDLLDYARVGREAASVGDVEIDALCADALAMLGADDRFTLSVSGDAQTARTYETPLRHVLLNLITNAIRHHDRNSGALSISCRRLGDRLEIAVADDGPGIDPQYHARIFGIFEMLKSRDEVEGSGMGLAIIRKTVEHYGGEISVRSEPDAARGATFVFTWPIDTADATARMAA